MTLEALKTAIANLVAKREKAHGDQAEQERLNAKLNKLYECKYLMLAQMNG